MLQKRLTLTPDLKLSLAPRGAFGWIRALRTRLGAITTGQVVTIGLVVGGQITLAYAALTPADRPEPDGDSSLRLLLPYSAVMLGYLSSYWGLWKPPESDDDDAPYSPRRAALAERTRLVASLAPTIVSGTSMLMPMLLPATAGVLTLIAGFLFLFGMEVLGTRVGMPIAGQQVPRWIIGFAAIAILLNVVSIRVWNVSLLF